MRLITSSMKLAAWRQALHKRNWRNLFLKYIWKWISVSGMKLLKGIQKNSFIFRLYSSLPYGAKWDFWKVSELSLHKDVKYIFQNFALEISEDEFRFVILIYLLFQSFLNFWKAYLSFQRWEQTFIDTKLIFRYWINPYPTAFPYGNGIVLHFYQQQESSTTKTVHRIINKGLKTYV